MRFARYLLKRILVLTTIIILLSVNSLSESPPVLTHSMVEFGDYNPETGKAGDFIFDNSIVDKVFEEFGEEAYDGFGGTKTLPHYTFFLSLDARIYAPTDGEVVMLTYQEDWNDYEILVGPTSLSDWKLNYDHIRNVPGHIVEGYMIQAGEYIGTPGVWYMDVGFIELTIMKDLNNGFNENYCPYDFFTPELKVSFSQGLNNLMTDWESYNNDMTIYDEESYVSPGCFENTVEEKIFSGESDGSVNDGVEDTAFESIYGCYDNDCKMQEIRDNWPQQCPIGQVQINNNCIDTGLREDDVEGLYDVLDVWNDNQLNLLQKMSMVAFILKD